MCVIYLAQNVHSRFKLVLALNRDEEYLRPTQQAGFWKDHPTILAGRDLKAGGTWAGITRQGRYAAITNYREPAADSNAKASRGEIVVDALTSTDSASNWIERFSARADQYPPFNLILGDQKSAHYYTNRAKRTQEVSRGVFALSNAFLDSPWPKVIEGRRAFDQILHEGDDLNIERIFSVLRNEKKVRDELLPDTGVGLELERMLSPIFIRSATYGTRSTTLITVSENNEVYFKEITFVPAVENPVREFRFQIELPPVICLL